MSTTCFRPLFEHLTVEACKVGRRTTWASVISRRRAFRRARQQTPTNRTRLTKVPIANYARPPSQTHGRPPLSGRWRQSSERTCLAARSLVSRAWCARIPDIHELAWANLGVISITCGNCPLDWVNRSSALMAHWRRITCQCSHDAARSIHIGIRFDMLRWHVRKNANHFVHEVIATSSGQTREQHTNTHGEDRRCRRTNKIDSQQLLSPYATTAWFANGSKTTVMPGTCREHWSWDTSCGTVVVGH